MPHFIPIVVIVGMLNLFLSPTNGIYGNVSRALGISPVNPMGTAALHAIIKMSSGWNNLKGQQLP